MFLMEYRLDIELNPRPSNCGKIYHIQCERFWPLLISASARSSRQIHEFGSIDVELHMTACNAGDRGNGDAASQAEKFSYFLRVESQFTSRLPFNCLIRSAGPASGRRWRPGWASVVEWLGG